MISLPGKTLSREDSGMIPNHKTLIGAGILSGFILLRQMAHL